MSRTILIVEDFPDYRALLHQTIRQMGFEALSCGGGRRAMEILKGGAIDLVISDIHMPDGDGLWLLKQLRQSKDLTPVILMTGGAEVYDLGALGAAGLLRKPFQIELLRNTIAKLL